MKRHLLIASLALAGCATQKSSESKPADAIPQPMTGAKSAFVMLEAKSGSRVEGDATFKTEGDGKVTVTLRVRNLTEGAHAAHLHEKGDCSADDAASAGPHWNPTTENHGKWGHAPHHLGDLGNIDVKNDGTGELTLTTDRWTIGDGQPTDILGKSVIVHANADDFVSQPAGAAGGRVACGVLVQQ